MFHQDRQWQVVRVENIRELADKLTNYSWCCCNGFELDGYLFLNDATNPDGAQEYAFVRQSDLVQVESVTMSWCNTKEALRYLQRCFDGEFTDEFDRIRSEQIQTPKEHESCYHCM